MEEWEESTWSKLMWNLVLTACGLFTEFVCMLNKNRLFGWYLSGCLSQSEWCRRPFLSCVVISKYELRQKTRRSVECAVSTTSVGNCLWFRFLLKNISFTFSSLGGSPPKWKSESVWSKILGIGRQRMRRQRQGRTNPRGGVPSFGLWCGVVGFCEIDCGNGWD